MNDLKDHEEPRPNFAEESERRRLIAEAAYYEAERRGFTGDRTLDDWLEAEARIDGRAAKAGPADAARLSENAEPGTIASTGAVPDRHEAAAKTETIAPDQVRPWARRLKVSPVRLREAIRRIGSAVKDVKGYLQHGDTKHQPRR
ncbi:MAG TPA: DUF3606 domain-containing protein [Burkholderiales bacterium]|nr:DUF3606 domain-containing protein [Burkholderiales bacterium]